MEQVKATISDDDGVLIERVTAWIQRINRQRWGGHFITLQDDIYELEQYLFKTTDGRSARIQINQIIGGSNRDTRVEFVGDGPLE